MRSSAIQWTSIYKTPYVKNHTQTVCLQECIRKCVLLLETAECSKKLVNGDTNIGMKMSCVSRLSVHNELKIQGQHKYNNVFI